MWGVPSLSTLSAPSPAIPESVLCLDGAGCKGSFQAFLVKSPSARLPPRFDERRVATVESRRGDEQHVPVRGDAAAAPRGEVNTAKTDDTGHE